MGAQAGSRIGGRYRCEPALHGLRGGRASARRGWERDRRRGERRTRHRCRRTVDERAWRRRIHGGLRGGGAARVVYRVRHARLHRCRTPPTTPSLPEPMPTSLPGRRWWAIATCRGRSPLRFPASWPVMHSPWSVSAPARGRKRSPRRSRLARGGMDVDWYATLKIASEAPTLVRDTESARVFLANGQPPAAVWGGPLPSIRLGELALDPGAPGAGGSARLLRRGDRERFGRRCPLAWGPIERERSPRLPGKSRAC